MTDTATIPSRATVTLPCAADPEAWYEPAQEQAAKTACGYCPVRNNCLALALAADEPWGVWGGYTETERQRLNTGRQPQRCTGCQLDCVPARTRQKQCDTCTGTPTGGSVYNDRERIAYLAADGLTDRQIAERLGWTMSKIKQCRVRYDIPSKHPNGGHFPADPEKLRPCGTYAAYRRHLRRGEPVDVACVQANQRRSQDRRETARAG